VTLNEAQTRAFQIDPQLRAADWKLSDRTQVRLEVPVDGYDAEPWNGVTDYCLYDASGNVLAVVEAKRCSRSPREADEQLRHYVTEISKKQPFAPFGFMANGHDIGSGRSGLLIRVSSRAFFGKRPARAVWTIPGFPDTSQA
jgi:type I site-specific restriction endonuclease